MRRLLRKICNKCKHLYWKLTSLNKKKAYESGKRKRYRYEDEIFCNSRDEFLKIVDEYSGKIDQFWSAQTEFTLNNFFQERHKKAAKLIFEDFLPLFPQKPVLMDVGCASGEWTLKIAPECEMIDGFEYSANMVATAKCNGAGVGNVNFYQADARSMQLNKIYDGAIISAMLMYIDNTETIYEILKNVYNHIAPGAYLCTRDTLNNENTDVVFLYNIRNGYNGVYWNKEIYYEQFYRAGFVLRKEVLLEEVTTRYMDFIGIGNIWQKTNE